MAILKCLRYWPGFTRLVELNSLVVLLLLTLLSAQSQAQEVRINLVDADGEPVSGAVAELLLPTSLRGQYQQGSRSIVDQVDKEFVPSITTIVAGSQVSFPNSDNILHHVYSFSSTKTFNIPLYGRGENDDYFESFEEPGIVEIGCNIHDWMLAYIYVGESNLMAVSNERGELRLIDLPEGDYQLKIWHSRLDTDGNFLIREIELEAGSSLELDLTLQLQRDRRLRRSPSANRSRYR